MVWWLFEKKKLGLALGGGVARGIAHIGVLKVLDQNKIPIRCIAATSSGAIIGAAYAAGLGIGLIEEIALRISWGRILKVAFFRPGFISSSAIEELIVKYVGDKKFSDLKIPLAVVASDIKTGQPVAITQGKIAKAIAASSAFPGLVAPEEIEKHYLVDGGLGDNLPVDVAKKMGADFVVAVDVVPSLPAHSIPHDAFQMYGRAFDIIMYKLSVNQRKMADILIQPQIEEDIWHLDLHKAKRLIAAGEAAAHRVLNKIKRKV